MSVTLVLLAACRTASSGPSTPSSLSPTRRRAASTSSRRSVSSTYSPRLSTTRAAPAVVTSTSEPSPSADSYFTSPAPSPPQTRLASPGIHAQSLSASPGPSPTDIQLPNSSLSATAASFLPPMLRSVSNSQRSIRSISRRGSDASKTSINDGFRPQASAAPAITTTANDSIGLGPAPSSRTDAPGRTSRASSMSSETMVDAQGALGAVGAGPRKEVGPGKLKKKSSFSLPFTRRSASVKEPGAPGSAEGSASVGTLGERLKRTLSRK